MPDDLSTPCYRLLGGPGSPCSLKMPAGEREIPILRRVVDVLHESPLYVIRRLALPQTTKMLDIGFAHRADSDLPAGASLVLVLEPFLGCGLAPGIDARPVSPYLPLGGFEWRWTQADSGVPMPPLIGQTMPGRLPPFVVSLLPEGWLSSVLHDRDERAMLRSGRRYMSNITMAENADELAALALDVLATPLAAH